MLVLSVRFASTEGSRFGLGDLEESNTIWRQIRGISYLKKVNLRRFRQLMVI